MVPRRMEDHIMNRIIINLNETEAFQVVYVVCWSFETTKISCRHINSTSKIDVFGQLQDEDQQNGALRIVILFYRSGLGKKFFCCHVLEFEHSVQLHVYVRMIISLWIVNSGNVKETSSSGLQFKKHNKIWKFGFM